MKASLIDDAATRVFPEPRLQKSYLPGWLTALLTPLASLRLTVWLFVLSMILILCGTLAQAESGIWTVVGRYFRSGLVYIPLRVFSYIPGLKGYLPPAAEIGGGFYFPGGWLLGGLMLANLLAAHAVRFQLSWKRSGILILHFGLVIMLLSELVTGLFAVEGKMLIYEGASANAVYHTEQTELAVIDRSDPKTDDVVVIPQPLLTAGKRIQDPELPFDVVVLRYMKNSDLLPYKDGPNPATAGEGRRWLAEERPEEQGASTEQRQDLASAYVQLFQKGIGESLGTYLVSVMLSPPNKDAPQKVVVNGKEYLLYLRFKQSPKPYTIHLLDFQHDKYPGTEKPRNFASRVRLTDPAADVDREVLISMNAPMRYNGEAFYQAGFDEVADQYTILQVVKNPGWLLPYFSCAIVTLGMVIHFVMVLRRFLARPRGVRAAAQHEWPYARYLPWGVAVLAICYLAMHARRPTQGEMNMEGFGELAVQYQGRIQPIQTVARNSLMIISKRTEYEDQDEKKHSAVEWLLDVFARRDVAMKQRVFRIENDEVLNILGLEPRKHFRYALDEFVDRLGQFEDHARKAKAKSNLARTFTDHKVLELHNQLMLYMSLSQKAIPQMIPPGTPDGEWRTYEQAEAAAMALAVQHAGLGEMNRAEILKKLHADEKLQEKLVASLDNAREQISPAFKDLGDALAAYARQNAHDFNLATGRFRAFEMAHLGEALSRSDFEVLFNRLDLFYYCSVLYVIAFLLACIGWMEWGRPANQAAFWLLIVALAAHTFAILARMYLQGRPPITNLYATAVFIGWAAVIFGVVYERLFKNGFGNAMAAMTGFSTLIIAHHLSADGDTLEMLQAVLDTNFWLATHVTTINLGYAAAFVAGGFATFYVLGRIALGLFAPASLPSFEQTLGRMIYGTTCFAVLFSFVGTVLGGIWADQSWGRFWGWDPKENGALLVVLISATILHARWAGMIKLRGMAVLALVGNIITAWSWHGTNLLGVGLHAYGFTSGREMWLCGYWLSQLLLIGVAFLPIKPPALARAS